jgi:hypothetical protein
MKTPDGKVGHYFGAEEDSLKNKTKKRIKQGKSRTRIFCNLVVPGQISRDLAPYIRARRGAAEGHNQS